MRSDRIAVFLDRDGTLIEDAGFLRSPDSIQMIRGAGEAIRALNRRGIPTCIVSNQSGVARGLFSENDLGLIHDRLQGILHSQGAHLDRIEYCPHHPSEGLAPYKTDCDCRKPKTGMLQRLARDLKLSLPHSFVVGDKLSDIELGKNVGATTFLVLTGCGRTTVDEARAAAVEPDYVVPSLVEAVNLIIEKIGGVPVHHD